MHPNCTCSKNSPIYLILLPCPFTKRASPFLFFNIIIFFFWQFFYFLFLCFDWLLWFKLCFFLFRFNLVVLVLIFLVLLKFSLKEWTSNNFIFSPRCLVSYVIWLLFTTYCIQKKYCFVQMNCFVNFLW